jgi:allantoin racemase
MRIFVINPNTSEAMTAQIRNALKAIKRKDTELYVTCLATGPETIESAYDAAYAVPPTLDLVQRANIEGYDAVVIACFSDPGLQAARELSRIPVFGIQETSIHVAAMLGAGFAVMTPRAYRVNSKRLEILHKRMGEHLVCVLALDMTTTETTADPAKTKARAIALGREAIARGAEVAVLGCAGMAGYADAVEAETGIKVLDPTAVTFKVAEGLTELGIKHSKIGLYTVPPEKPFRR